MGEAIQAYRGVTATDEFKSLEWLRAKTRRDEANALSHARKKEREHWQGVIAEIEAAKDARIAKIEAEKDARIAELEAQLKNKQ